VLALAILGAFRRDPRSLDLDQLTVRHINIVDSTGQVRVMLAGSFPPRRTETAGLLFINNDGIEAGGLTYRGHQAKGDQIAAGSILTMDQYNEDQIVALQYSQRGLQKQQGLTFSDRPDTMGPALRTLYSVLDTFPSGPKRDSVRLALIAKVPPDQLWARRVFVGRDTTRTAVVNLADRTGVPRLRLSVDSLGNASITFLDAHGHVTRQITGGS
jgi:hypothetical protein